MARDLLSIPGMSAEVERLFSSAQLMLVDIRASLQEDIIEEGNVLEVGWKEVLFNTFHFFDNDTELRPDSILSNFRLYF